MLRRWSAVVLVIFGAGAFYGTSVAIAEPPTFLGRAECGSNGGPGCDVSAESGKGSRGTPDSGNESPGNSGAGGGAPQVAEAEPSCEEVDAGAQECEAGFDQAGLEADEPAVDPATVANGARDSLVLPEPEMDSSPSADVPVLVRVPVWLWVDDESWRSESAEAEVPAGSVSVTATPTVADWSMGDGSTVSCEGPGVPFTAGRDDPAAESPECGHTYTRASAGEPKGAYRVGVEVTWEVTWESSEGDGGELEPLVTSASEDLDVVESHGLVEDAG